METELSTNVDFFAQMVCTIIGLALGGYAYKRQGDAIKEKDAWAFVVAGGFIGFVFYKLIFPFLLLLLIILGCAHVLQVYLQHRSPPRPPGRRNPLLQRPREPREQFDDHDPGDWTAEPSPDNTFDDWSSNENTDWDNCE